jgi:hypothetical protein
MRTYRIRRTFEGWGLFKNGSVRPIVESENEKDIVRLAAEILAEKGGAVRIISGNGNFQELRF